MSAYLTSQRYRLAGSFAPTSHGIKSSMGADWRDHAGANQPSSRPRSISRQLRDWSGPYSCPAFRGKCRTSDDSKGRLVVFLVRISNIYIYIWYPDQDQSRVFWSVLRASPSSTPPVHGFPESSGYLKFRNFRYD